MSIADDLVLLTAVSQIREDYQGENYGVQSDFMFAVADWLEEESVSASTRYLNALDVARAYLG